MTAQMRSPDVSVACIAAARPVVAGGRRVVAVIVTHDRPQLLRLCLDAVLAQSRPPDAVIVIDNASGQETAALLGTYPAVQTIRLDHNGGGAAGFKAGMTAALQQDSDWLWLMDDDGRPAGQDCLARLLDTAAEHRAAMVGAMIVDIEAPARLAFPVRLRGRTVFSVATLVEHGPLPGFAHLFNGVLLAAGLVNDIGLPEAGLFIRGDEVEFLYRARRAGARIVLDPGAPFLHPGSQREITPILFGLFYAVVPADPVKQFYQFRNRGYIFRRYGMWGWMAADVVRYGWYYLVERRVDIPGLSFWLRATWTGIVGRFLKDV